jgi:hypothetical protein
MLGRKHRGGVDVERLLLRLGEIDGGGAGAMLGIAVDRVDEILIGKFCELNLKRLASPPSQVVERRSLVETLPSPESSSETWRNCSV